MYPMEDPVERQQIEWVFTLTGGELAEKPLRYAERAHGLVRGPGGALLDAWLFHRSWARYYYDGYPSYAEEVRALERRHGGDFVTIVKDCTFALPPRAIWARGKRWVRVASYTSSGETECPERGEIVTEERCPLCEAERGEEHGVIYIGEGWTEIVYRAR